MPGVDFDVLRREITMPQVLDEIGFQATHRDGDQLRGPCPVHGSTSREQPCVFGEPPHGSLLLSPMQITWQPTRTLGCRAQHHGLPSRGRFVSRARPRGAMDQAMVNHHCKHGTEKRHRYLMCPKASPFQKTDPQLLTITFQLLQQLLGEAPFSSASLLERPADLLSTLLEDLQQRLRSRENE